MNLIIFTPAISTSAIGRMACIVIRALISQGHKVTVVRTEKEHLLETPTHDFGTELIQWNDIDQVIRVTNDADALVYQIGDNFEFHRGGIEWLPKLPGLVCLHDFYLGHLFCGWAQTRRQEADAVLCNWYGDEIASRFFDHSYGEKFIDNTLESSPMTEWICSMAYGILTHSSWGIGRVLNSCPGPVQVVPLANDAATTLIDIPQFSCVDNSKFKLLTMGYINSNKCVASVISAIGNSPLLRGRTIYRLVGNILPEMAIELSALARKYQVNLVISGVVDDVTLGMAIQDADVITCLRKPSLEAGSASAIEAMLHGKLIIVAEAGFYTTIPSDCAVKISHECRIFDIQSALEYMATEPNQRIAIGLRAKKWAAKEFTAQNYATRLAVHATEVCKAEPQIKAINHFSNLMQRWSSDINILSARDRSACKF
jgi:glycosyltransferase involved in cell wall biosynthesis